MARKFKALTLVVPPLSAMASLSSSANPTHPTKISVPVIRMKKMGIYTQKLFPCCQIRTECHSEFPGRLIIECKLYYATNNQVYHDAYEFDGEKQLKRD